MRWPLQVFPTAGYEQLYASLRKSAANGGPTYHEATYTVLTNPYQAVFGGWQVTGNRLLHSPELLHLTGRHSSRSRSVMRFTTYHHESAPHLSAALLATTECDCLCCIGCHPAQAMVTTSLS